jgi:hypothetical protein
MAMRLNREMSTRQTARRRTTRKLSISVESLEGRALLSGFHGLARQHEHMALANHAEIAMFGAQHRPLGQQVAMSVMLDAKKQKGPTGVVTKKARFYEFYTGPKLAELNTVGASVKLSRDGSTFAFTGKVKGNINDPVAVYVWGIDRSGSLGTGPFQGRPNIRFDAVVTVSLDASLTPTATVIDLKTFNRTTLSAGSAKIQGKKITVTVPSSLLPSTGLATSQYRFNFWPDNMSENGVASFAPESSTAQVGRSK